MSGAGMILISPDGLLLRLIGDVSTWNIIFYRSVFIALSLGTFLLLRERRNISAIWENFGRIGLISTMLMVSGNMLFVAAITHTSVANTLVLVATMPFFSAVLGWLLLRETVKPRTLVSMVFALAGIFIIFSGSFGAGNWTGDLLAVGTAFMLGLNLVVLRKLKDRDITIRALCLSGIIAAIIVLPLSQPMAVTKEELSILMLLGLFIIPLALVLFFGGTRHAPAAEIALLSLVETVLGPFWAWIGVGEIPSERALVGGGIVIGAVALNAWMGMRKYRYA